MSTEGETLGLIMACACISIMIGGLIYGSTVYPIRKAKESGKKTWYIYPAIFWSMVIFFLYRTFKTTGNANSMNTGGSMPPNTRVAPTPLGEAVGANAAVVNGAKPAA